MFQEILASQFVWQIANWENVFCIIIMEYSYGQIAYLSNNLLIKTLFSLYPPILNHYVVNFAQFQSFSPTPETPTLYHLSPELQIPHKYSCDLLLLIHCTKVSYIRVLLCCRSYKLFYHQVFWRIFARQQLTITESEKLFLEISKRKLKINASYINNKTKRKSKPNLHNTYEYKIYKIKLYYWYEEIYALKYLWKNKLQNKPKESKMKELMEIKV